MSMETQDSTSSNCHGQQDHKIIWHTLLPNLYQPIIVQFTIIRFTPFFCSLYNVFQNVCLVLSTVVLTGVSCQQHPLLRHTKGLKDWVEGLRKSWLSWGCLNSVVKAACTVTFSFQAVVSSSESVALCISLRLGQCANNYSEPEACVCIWRGSCAVGGMCAAAIIQAQRCN